MSYALQTLEDEVATSALARNSNKGDHDPEQRAREEKYVRAFAKRVKVATVRECTAGQRITAKLLGERYPSLQAHGRQLSHHIFVPRVIPLKSTSHSRRRKKSLKGTTRSNASHSQVIVNRSDRPGTATERRRTRNKTNRRDDDLHVEVELTAEQCSVATPEPDGNANGDSCSSSDEEDEGEGLRIDPKEDEMFLPNLMHPVDVRGAFLEKVWSRQALLIRNNPRTVTKTSVSVPSFPGELAAGELQQSMVDRARATAHGIIKEAPAMWARYAFLTALDKLEAKRGAKKAPAPQNKDEEDGGPHNQHIDDAKLAFPDCCVALPADHVSCLGAGALRGLGPSARDERQAEEAVTLARYVPLDVKRFRAAEKRLGDLPQDLEEFLMRMYDEADLEERSSTSDKENGEAGEQGGEDDDNEVDSGRENTSAKMEGAVALATHEEKSRGHQNNSDSSQDNSEEQSQPNDEIFLPAEVPFDQTDEGIRRRAEIGKFMERFETLVSDYLFDLDVTALVNAVPENGRGEQEVFVWMDPNHHNPNPNPNHKQHASSGAAAKPHSSHSGALRAFFRAREKECVDAMESTAAALRKGDAVRRSERGFGRRLACAGGLGQTNKKRPRSYSQSSAEDEEDERDDALYQDERDREEGRVALGLHSLASEGEAPNRAAQPRLPLFSRKFNDPSEAVDIFNRLPSASALYFRAPEMLEQKALLAFMKELGFDFAGFYEDAGSEATSSDSDGEDDEDSDREDEVEDVDEEQEDVDEELEGRTTGASNKVAAVAGRVSAIKSKSSKRSQNSSSASATKNPTSGGDGGACSSSSDAHGGSSVAAIASSSVGGVEEERPQRRRGRRAAAAALHTASGASQLHERSEVVADIDDAAAEDDTTSCDGAAGWCKNLQKKSKQTRSEIETFVSKKGHITDWHTDFQENFTVQLQGVKRWYIKRGELTEPILGMTPHYDVDVNDPTQENEMRYYLKHQTRRAPKVEWINGEPRCTVIKPDGATTATGAAGRSQHSQDQNGELHFPNSSCNNGADIDELLTPGQTEYRPGDGYFAADCDVIEVYPGDVLYFPSGMWHRVETVSEEHSISINFSLSGKRWSDLIGDSLKQVMNNHPSLRQKVVGCFSQEDFRNKAGFYLNLAGRWLGAHAGFGRPTRNQVQPEWPNQLQRAFLPSIAMMAARYRSMDVLEYLQSDVARVDWKHGLLDSMPTQKHFFLHSLSAKAEFRDLKSWHCLGKDGDLHVSHWYSFSPVMTLMKAPAKMKRREATSIFERNKQLVEQCETLLLKAPGLPDVKVGAVITGLTMLGYDHDEVEENKTREADETGPGSRSFTMENQKEWSDTRHAGLGFFVTSNNSADRVAFYCAAHHFNDLFEGKKFPAEIPDATMAETMRNHRRSKRKREDEILESKDEKEKKDQHMEGGHGDEDDENNCGPVNCSEMHEAGEGAALCGAGGEGRGYEEQAPVVPPTRKRRCVAQGKKAAAAPPTSLSASQKQKKAKAMKGPPSVVTKTCKKASKKAAAKNRYSTDAKQNVEADEEDPPAVLDDDEAEAGGGGGGTQHKNSASGGSSSSSASALVDLERGACWRQLLTVLSGVLEPETYVLHASFQDTNASAARLEFHLVFPAGNRDSNTTTSSGGNASSPAAPKGQHGSDVEVELMRFGLIGAGKNAFPFRGFSAFRPPLDKRDTTPLTPFEFAWVKFLFRELVAAQARPTTIMLGQTLANFRANSLHAAWTAPYFELLVPKRYQMPRLHRLGLLVFNLLLREAFLLSGASDNPLFRPPDGFGVDVDHAMKMARGGGGGGETDEEVEESQSLYEIGGGPLLFDGHHDARAGAPGRAGGARRGGGGAGGGRGERSSRRLFEMVDALDDMELDSDADAICVDEDSD